MSWFMNKAAKAAVGTGKFGYNKLFAGNPLAAGVGLLTTAGYATGAMEEWKTTDSKPMTAAKYSTALAVDLAVDAGINWATAPLMAMGPWGMAAGVGIQMAANMAGPGFVAAFDHMDEKYNQMRNKGNHYQMSQSSAQTLQRQMSNLHGAGSNLAEMMHN